ncbi:MAG: hypothetical protein KKF67_03000 [Nanoarchaeota archaeon]|nr:hypothetical protein [Nanoarchaeota archaeon]
MIRIKNESDFKNWFKKNYKKIGFSKIIKSSTKSCPDFIMLEGNKEVKVELEIKTSNFLMHNHSSNNVDKVICVIEDIKLEIPTIKIDNIKLIKFREKDSFYSFKRQICKLVRKNKILTTSEVISSLKISRGAAEKALLELAIEGKIERIKKQGVNLWMLK